MYCNRDSFSYYVYKNTEYKSAITQAENQFVQHSLVSAMTL